MGLSHGRHRWTNYERGVAAGMAPADMFDEMQLYMSRQPAPYLDMMNWWGKPAARQTAQV